MTDPLNILRLLRHLLVALVQLHDGSIDVSQPLMMLVVHQLSVSTRTDDDGSHCASSAIFAGVTLASSRSWAVVTLKRTTGADGDQARIAL
ncbi:MAG: hypothetical protein ACLQGN_10735 [Mycobacterium sp.]|jgi:hypothetical protein|uniref:hypothetical protein n=1 Tax=Mycobacterium sp. TaxID=1785 RepID=UPI003F9BD7C8